VKLLLCRTTTRDGGVMIPLRVRLNDCDAGYHHHHHYDQRTERPFFHIHLITISVFCFCKFSLIGELETKQTKKK
jgi:hypothetical protein